MIKVKETGLLPRIQKLEKCLREQASKTGGCPRRLSPKVIQNLRGTKGYQSKVLDRKPKGTKAKLWIAKLRAKLRANLWFASLTKQSFVWRQNFVQNFVLQAIQSLQSFACKNSVFASTSFVRRLQAFGEKFLEAHDKLCFLFWKHFRTYAKN